MTVVRADGQARDLAGGLPAGGVDGARAAQPAGVVPSTSKVTAPAPGAGATVAVNVMLWPGAEGLALLARPVVVVMRSGVTAFEGAVASPVPTALVALTVNV